MIVTTWEHGATVYTEMNEFDGAESAPSTDEETGNSDWEALKDRLIDIGRLSDDWDGEGSAAPSRAVMAGATKLVSICKAEQYPPADRVIPSVNGTVYFEWYLPDGYLEIEVTSPFHAEWRFVAKGSDKADVFAIQIP